MKTNKTKRNIAIALSIAVTVSILGTVLFGSSVIATAAEEKIKAGAPQKNLITIRTYTRKNCTSTPILAADQKGFFAAEGLKIEYTGELKPTDILPSVIQGSNDFAETHPNALATYIAGGAAIKGVARSIIEPGPSVASKYRHMWWFVKKDSPIKTWTQFKNYKQGQQIVTNGLAPNCVTFVLSTIFDKYKLNRDRIKFVNFDTDQAALTAVSSGSLDLAGVHPTFYKYATDAGLRKIGDSSDAGLGEAAGVYLYYFTNDFIEKKPEIVQKFVNAVTKAQVWANQNPKEAAKITSVAIGTETDAVHYYSPNSVIIEKQIAPWINDLVANGKLKKDQYKITDIITHKFEVKQTK